LLGKSLAASAALGFLALAGVHFWPVLVFFSAMLAIYLSESPERRTLRISFWLVSVFSVLGMVAVSPLLGHFFSGLLTVFLVVFFGIAVFCVLGLVNLLFKDRFLAYSILNASVWAYFFLLLFYFMPDFSNMGFWGVILWLIGLFIGSRFIIKETLVFGGLAKGRTLNVVLWSLSLITAEIALFAALLPLGFVNAAAFLTFFSILARDVVLARLGGRLNLALIFRELTIFAVVLSLIFATVTWILP
jgi:hypothetical protein